MSDSSQLMNLADQGRLELTLTVRETIIRGLTKDGKIPEAEEDRSLLIKALDGMDRTVLSKAKIKSDDKNANKQAHAANMVAQMLLTAAARRTGVRTEPVQLGSDIPEPDLVDGETYIGIQTFKSAEILGEDN